MKYLCFLSVTGAVLLRRGNLGVQDWWLLRDYYLGTWSLLSLLSQLHTSALPDPSGAALEG